MFIISDSRSTITCKSELSPSPLSTHRPSINYRAKKWAIAAGREDLLEKKINSLIKYFLCSEHFTEECFLDPPNNTRLKKLLRPEVWFPIPSIFTSNIDKYIPEQKAQSDAEEVPDCEPNYVEEHFNYDALTEVDLNDSDCPDLTNLVTFKDSDTFPQIDVYNAFDFIIEQSPDSAPLFSSDLEYDSSSIGVLSRHCRLCAMLSPEDTMATISAIPAFEEKLQRLLPGMVSRMKQIAFC